MDATFEGNSDKYVVFCVAVQHTIAGVGQQDEDVGLFVGKIPHCVLCSAGPKTVFLVQLDECGWPQDEHKWTNGHAVRYSLNKPKHRNEIDVY